MRQPLTIIPATTTDIAFLANSNAAMAWETERKMLDRNVLVAGVGAVLADSRRGFYLIARHARDDLGCVLITHEWSDWRNGSWWWLQSVYVVPVARRGGVFRALYADVERRARDTPNVIGLRLYVERENNRAQKVYANAGMHETAYRFFESEFARATR